MNQTKHSFILLSNISQKEIVKTPNTNLEMNGSQNYNMKMNE
jgi:hypothetical protein